jgi:signal transduction histidine kinase
MNLTFINKNIVIDENNINVPELKNEIKAMTSVIDESVKSIRKIITELRPEVLDNLGLLPAIEWQVKEFEIKSGIKSYLENLCGDININSDISIAVYRIFQEALTNIARHAKASEIYVKIERLNQHLRLEIKDNGIGFNPDKPGKKQTFGVLGMKERVIILGGDFKIEKASPYGTIVTVNIPLEIN